MIIIFVIVLIMFGAKKLPEFAKGLGQAVREFSKAKENVNQELHNASHVVENSLYHPPIETQALPASAPTASVDLSKPADAPVAAVPVQTVGAVTAPAPSPAQTGPSATPVPEALKPQV